MGNPWFLFGDLSLIFVQTGGVARLSHRPGTRLATRPLCESRAGDAIPSRSPIPSPVGGRDGREGKGASERTRPLCRESLVRSGGVPAWPRTIPAPLGGTGQDSRRTRPLLQVVFF